MLLRQVLDGDIVIDFEPFESLHVFSLVLQDVSDHVRPPSLFVMIPLRLRVLIRSLRRAQLRIVATHFPLKPHRNFVDSWGIRVPIASWIFFFDSLIFALSFLTFLGFSFKWSFGCEIIFPPKLILFFFFLD